MRDAVGHEPVLLLRRGRADPPEPQLEVSAGQRGRVIDAGTRPLAWIRDQFSQPLDPSYKIPMPRDLRLNPPIPALYPQRDALLAAVRDAHPDDDLPALVYADWQDEHGQSEHAELIRVMVELAKNPRGQKEVKERRTELLSRIAELFKTPAIKLLRRLEPNLLNFQRGFINPLSLWVEDNPPPKYSPRLARKVILVEKLADLPAVVPFDKLAWLSLRLPDRLTTHLVATVAAQPWLGRIDRLWDFRFDSHTSTELLAPLIASPYLGNLLAIEFEGPISVSALVGVFLAKSASLLREFPLGKALIRTTPNSSTTPTRRAALSAVEKIISTPRAGQFTSFGHRIVDADEPLAKILLASKHLTGIREFRYTFEKATAKTQAAFVERFGKPERV